MKTKQADELINKAVEAYFKDFPPENLDLDFISDTYDESESNVLYKSDSYSDIFYGISFKNEILDDLLTEEEIELLDEDDINEIQNEIESRYEEMLDEKIINEYSDDLHDVEWYSDPNGGGAWVREAKIPDEAVLVAEWSNFGPNCLGKSDFLYIENSLYFYKDEFIVFEDSYKYHPTHTCLARTLSIIDDFPFDDVIEEKIIDKDLFERACS